MDKINNEEEILEMLTNQSVIDGMSGKEDNLDKVEHSFEIDNDGDIDDEGMTAEFGIKNIRIDSMEEQYTVNQEARDFYQLHGFTKKDQIKWKKGVTYITPQISWDNAPFKNAYDLPKPIDFFNNYITEDLIVLMAEMTNLYAVQNNAVFSPAS